MTEDKPQYMATHHTGDEGDWYVYVWTVDPYSYTAWISDTIDGYRSNVSSRELSSFEPYTS